MTWYCFECDLSSFISIVFKLLFNLTYNHFSVTVNVKFELGRFHWWWIPIHSTLTPKTRLLMCWMMSKSNCNGRPSISYGLSYGRGIWMTTSMIFWDVSNLTEIVGHMAKLCVWCCRLRVVEIRHQWNLSIMALL